MLLDAKDLIEEYKSDLLSRRQLLSYQPVLALVWIGEDKQTESFINAKIKLAKLLDCQLKVHHLLKAEEMQVEALIQTLNNNKEIKGLVLQLPMIGDLNTNRLINFIDPLKDVDNLTGKTTFPDPTPSAILRLLEYYKYELKNIVILGSGRLVGKPLSDILNKKGIAHDIVKEKAEEKSDFIKNHDILISATGKNIVNAEMVNENMVVIDASGVDVDSKTIEPLVKSVTPSKGVIGPLTVCELFDNLLTACGV